MNKKSERIYLDELRIFLKSQLYNLSDFAQKIGITQQGLQMILSGKRKRPYTRTLRAIAKEIGYEKIRIEKERIYFEKEDYSDDGLNEDEKKCLIEFRKLRLKRKEIIMNLISSFNEE